MYHIDVEKELEILEEIYVMSKMDTLKKWFWIISLRDNQKLLKIKMIS